jgi:1,4-alpha-glucan branching enzyme
MTTKVTFQLSPNIVSSASEGILVGDFNNWDINNAIKLKKQKDGSLKAIVPLEKGKTYSYRYLLNDGRWVNDDSADGYHFVSEFQIENCMITVPNEVKNVAPKTKKATTPKVETAAKPTKSTKATTSKSAIKATPKAKK